MQTIQDADAITGTSAAAEPEVPKTPAPVSLSDLDYRKKSAAGFTFPFLTEKGQKTGVTLTVLGSQSPKVQTWIRKSMNARRTEEAVQAKRGKPVERTVEDDEEFSFEAAAIRLVGWTGIIEPYSPESALVLCESNVAVRDQVFGASNDLGNFTKG